MKNNNHNLLTLFQSLDEQDIDLSDINMVDFENLSQKFLKNILAEAKVKLNYKTNNFEIIFKNGNVYTHKLTKIEKI